MDHKQSMQIEELTDYEVSCPYCLRTFFASDSNSNMSFNNHGYVIGPISNGDCDPVAIILGQTHHISLLLGGYSAADD